MFSGEAYRRDDVTTRYSASHSTIGRPGVPRGTRLPLEAHVETTTHTCTIRLPVRAEHVTVEKWPVVVEEVVVRTAQLDDSVRVGDSVRREELHVDARGDVDVTERRTPPGVFWER
jgi:stress response protein YsnF